MKSSRIAKSEYLAYVKMKKPPLTFSVIGQCSTTKARVGVVGLPHHNVDTPVFMPVGTQGTIKGILPDQLVALDCHIILANTYHLGTRPGAHLLEKAGGLHKFMGWNRGLLTDSGGFQMVSLLELAEINEEGVKFKSPYNDSECMLTPEHSIQIQNSIGADIIMQLDDVVDVKITGPRVEEAMHRTTRWVDRCLKAHQNPESQVIFPIIQGGLIPEWRAESVRQLLARNTYGIAIGGLSGGESKDDFWKVVHLSTNLLPRDKPRYLMGVGYAEDLVVCIALGVDMFDCVFPTRTARFGSALTDAGDLTIKNSTFAKDFRPICDDCDCSTCARYTRAYLHALGVHETVGCHLLTIHNIAYQLNLMRRIRQSILDGTFPQFVKKFMTIRFPNYTYPKWVVDALEAVSIKLDSQS